MSFNNSLLARILGFDIAPLSIFILYEASSWVAVARSIVLKTILFIRIIITKDDYWNG